ncbi:hypothetical protein N9O19_02240 [Euryarchaeota archaeon]|nr:hypothetical protein [Euryarchaeota archaeon]
MNKSGLDQLTDSLIEACKGHSVLKKVDEATIQKIITTLNHEQFSNDRKASINSLNYLLDLIVESLSEVV